MKYHRHVLAALVIISLGCSDGAAPNGVEATQTMIDSQHEHYHVHGQKVSHEHAHEGQEARAHAHEHQHEADEE